MSPLTTIARDKILNLAARYDALNQAIEELQQHFDQVRYTVEVEEGFEEGYVTGVCQSIEMLKTIRDNLGNDVVARQEAA